MALIVLAFTARGRADIVDEPTAVAPDCAAVAIAAEQIDDHRQEAFLVEGGADRRWPVEEERDALGERVGELIARGSRAPRRAR
jgi:hypothetical protein